jgi:hypothetical protein
MWQNVDGEHKSRKNRLRRQDVIGVSGRKLAPGLEQHDAVRILCRQVEIVQNRQDASALAREMADRCQDAVLVGQVEAGHGLVEEEITCAPGRSIPHLRQDTRELHALALTSRKRGIAALCQR